MHEPAGTQTPEKQIISLIRNGLMFGGGTLKQSSPNHGAIEVQVMKDDSKEQKLEICGTRLE